MLSQGSSLNALLLHFIVRLLCYVVVVVLVGDCQVFIILPARSAAEVKLRFVRVGGFCPLTNMFCSSVSNMTVSRIFGVERAKKCPSAGFFFPH